MIESWLLILIVAIYAVVQSVFGMGILVFGTPTLLLLGYEFVPTLQLLVPTSLAVSIFQVAGAGWRRPPGSRNLYLLCMPGIAVGLIIADFGVDSTTIRLLVGVALVASAALRLSAVSKEIITRVIRRSDALYHLAMGLVHGLTNLGGGMLSVLAAGKHDEKEPMRAMVAFYYLVFGGVQVASLIAVGQGTGLLRSLPLIATAVAVYLLVGNRVFKVSSSRAIGTALTGFIFAYGVVILASL